MIAIGMALGVIGIAIGGLVGTLILLVGLALAALAAFINGAI
jgi:hypothetical protein